MNKDEYVGGDELVRRITWLNNRFAEDRRGDHSNNQSHADNPAMDIFKDVFKGFSEETDER